MGEPLDSRSARACAELDRRHGRSASRSRSAASFGTRCHSRHRACARDRRIAISRVSPHQRKRVVLPLAAAHDDVRDPPRGTRSRRRGHSRACETGRLPGKPYRGSHLGHRSDHRRILTPWLQPEADWHGLWRRWENHLCAARSAVICATGPPVLDLPGRSSRLESFDMTRCNHNEWVHFVPPGPERQSLNQFGWRSARDA